MLRRLQDVSVPRKQKEVGLFKLTTYKKNFRSSNYFYIKLYAAHLQCKLIEIPRVVA